MFLDVTRLEKPKLFISSTMDRQTINYRKDMIEQLKNEGYEIIDFQSNDFPYGNTTDQTIINETIEAVAKANVFILIVDSNYGTIIDNKSVIHREYQRAKDLNKSVFVFIHKDVWSDFINKKISNNSLIKSQQHYDFISELAVYKISEFERAADCIKHLKNQLLNFLGGALSFSAQAKWLWNESYTRGIESNAQEVWIITPDFLWDFDDIQFHQIVIVNVVKRGCKYKYIYKATEENKKKHAEMMRKYKTEFKYMKKELSLLEEQIQFLGVKPNKFYWSSEQIIFNPFQRNERAIMVDIMDVRDKTLKFNIEYGFGKRIAFREQFINYWNANIKDKNRLINEESY
ncbi:DUF4062 domain-containing protein [Thomasclavelia spiroformis]|uniref:DUF4062 domain-containing protein n=1 Tax=Thomasclavelia spiroformis TaxID=29348 RepID=UPI000B3A23DD|nr:DUF4062 domain-containing protein [Thomasclavelia spiroformis]OUQ02755.1 hypothetical protein B5E98_04330 [Thomasclavelia spiroformis]